MINSQGPSVEHYHHYPCWPPPRATYRETRASSSARRSRSEEHTSELQSLMRISYAVFCLKKKTKHTRQIQNVRALRSDAQRHNYKKNQNISRSNSNTIQQLD